MKKMLVIVSLISISVFAQFKPPEGFWRGTWFNNTFGTTDSAFMTSSVDESSNTLEIILDLDGNVFGGSDPDPVTMTGPYDENGFSVSGNSPTYGDIFITGSSDGTITGRLPNVPNPNIDSTTLAGTFNADTVALTYLIYFGGSVFANGVINMVRDTTVVVPVELFSFSASIIDNYVELTWVTATEINNAGFDIERKDALNKKWEVIHFVEGFGTSTEMRNYSFVDKEVYPGKYSYRLKQVDYNGSYEYSNVVEVNINLPAKYELLQNYPNPFNPSTTIQFTLPEESFTKLEIFNVVGEKIETLVSETLSAGIHKYEWNAENLVSGVYFYRLTSDNFVQIKKLVLMK
jgi:hypothetical protein